MNLEKLSKDFVDLVWGGGAEYLMGIPFLVWSLLLAGLFFSIVYGFPQFRYFKHAIDIVRGKFDKPEDKGEISHFQALCAALSATIGLGNIAGVAAAIVAGGPGAVFWMWLAAVIGMCTKFVSITLALYYRHVDQDTGHVAGGPMFTIKNGLSKGFIPLAYMYATFTMLSAFGAGNMFQSNQVAKLLESNLGVADWVTGLVFAVLAGLVIIGGIKRIGNVAGKLVPAMVVLYFGSAVVILGMNYELIIPMIEMIFNDAFTGTAAIGGFAGVGVKEVVAQGVRRAVFSNEAGMGSAAMAHSAAKSTPMQEGIVGLLGPFIDTIVVCTITALVLLITGAWSNPGGAEGAVLTANAFGQVFGSTGNIIVTTTVVFFAFSTIISWSYYGEMGTEFLFGQKAVIYYRVVFVVLVMLGAVLEFTTVLNFSDAVFGLLAIPNLIANVMLTPKLKAELKAYKIPSFTN